MRILSLQPLRGFATDLFRRGLATPSYANSVTELIGKTPMVRLRRVVQDVSPSTKVLLKLEMQNPGGSVKDRIALSMIEAAEKRGEISPERTTIVEATSGNTGIGLAMVAAAKGYKMIVVMPQLPSMFERYILVRKFGGQVHLTSVMKDDFRKTIDNMIQYSKDLCEKNQNYWSPTQFETDDNPPGDPERISPQSSSVPIAAGATTLAATLPPLSFAVMVVPLA